MANDSCGTCAMCCKLPKIDEIGKPMGRWCEHCKPGSTAACSIFGEPARPKICGEYLCVWRMADLAPELRPDRCGFIIDTSDSDPNMLRVMVDPDKPDSWRSGAGGRALERLAQRGMRLAIVIGERKRKMITIHRDQPRAIEVREE